jgi:hypothetical protein
MEELGERAEPHAEPNRGDREALEPADDEQTLSDDAVGEARDSQEDR